MDKQRKIPKKKEDKPTTTKSKPIKPNIPPKKKIVLLEEKRPIIDHRLLVDRSPDEINIIMNFLNKRTTTTTKKDSTKPMKRSR